MERNVEDSGFSWPLRAADAKEAIKGVIALLFDPVLQNALMEWAALRRGCKLKAMKRHSLGKIAGKLEVAETCENVIEGVATASADEAFALLQSLLALKNSDCPNMPLMVRYRDEADYRDRWIAMMVNKSLEWAKGQRFLFEADEWLGNED